MKKSICFLLCLIMVFSSVSLCFATPVDWDSSDSQHLTEIRNAFVSGGTIYNMINAINSNIVNLNSNLVTLMGWLDPSSGGGTTALLNQILNALVYTNAGGTITSWLVDIQGYNYQTAERTLDLVKALTNHGVSNRSTVLENSHLSFVNNYQGDYVVGRFTNTSGGYQETTYNWNNGTPLGNIGLLLKLFNNSFLFNARSENEHNKDQQTFLSWIDLNNSNFSPTSSYNGIYQWLSNIQAPTARLAYVLASDERIAAQEAAAANEDAVVDNFIDSSGDGATSPSDIGSVSDLSSGYKQNFGSDASPSGIFDIFNSDHATWFSQETKNQLDTTTPTRLTKGSESETPLLDKQIEDIYNALGVKQP